MEINQSKGLDCCRLGFFGVSTAVKTVTHYLAQRIPSEPAPSQRCFNIHELGFDSRTELAENVCK